MTKNLTYVKNKYKSTLNNILDDYSTYALVVAYHKVNPNMSYQDIAREVGVTNTTVMKVLRAEGLGNSRTKGGDNRA